MAGLRRREHRRHTWRVVSRGTDWRGNRLTLWGCGYRSCIVVARTVVTRVRGSWVILEDGR